MQPLEALGLLLLLAATAVAALTSPRRRLREPAAGPAGTGARLGTALLLVDMAGLGLMGLVPEGNGLVLVLVLVGMWLGADHHLRGVGLTVVGTALLVSVPSLAYFGTDASSSSHALLVLLVVAMCSLTVAGASQVWTRQNAELEAQGQRLEEALAEVNANRALNDAIVTTVDVGLVAIDKDGCYTFTNPRHAEFLALAFPEGHEGRAGQVGSVFAADRVTRLTPQDTPTQRALSGETFTDYVVWVGEEHATQRALSVSAGPVLDGAGGFGGAVLVYTDITDLMSALKVKDDFVASVSHELRTPLTAIMGFLDLVLDERDAISPEVRQNLDVVKRNSERLLRLVSDLLSTAQAAEGHMTLEVQRTDLSELVELALADLAPRASDIGVLLRRSLPSGLMAQVDSVRIRQLVDNLVSNAIKYTPSGGEVTVRLEPEGSDVLLEVTDTGIGISPADQSRLFSRFFRTRDAETLAIQGIGLGLAITKSIAEAHGGTIQVKSQVGAGTTFLVRLPACGPVRDHGSSISTFRDDAPARIGSRLPVSTNPARS
jgi:signal transduction histidine kinase